MSQLFPYPHSVLSIFVDPSWVSHAQEYALLGKARNNVFRDILRIRRLADIAFRFAFYPEAPNVPLPNKKIPTKLNGKKVSLHARLASKYTFGDGRGIAISVKSMEFSDLHISVLYDPPHMDFIGWCSNEDVNKTGTLFKGKMFVPINHLKPISGLLKRKV